MAEGMNLILQDIARTLTAPDANVEFLQSIQGAILKAMKPQGSPRGVAGGGKPGIPGSGGPGPGGSPGGPPGMAPGLPGGPAGGGAPNPQMASMAAPTPGQGPSSGAPTQGLGNINPDEMRRMLQTQ